MLSFKATLAIIVGNPYVYLPQETLQEVFRQANKNKGPIPVRGTINGKAYQQTLVKYSGHWRLYINLKMLKNSPRRIGETLEIAIEFDPSDRSLNPPTRWSQALNHNKTAQQVFENLSPSRQKEIVRYLVQLKTEQSLERNVKKAINFLLGKGRFVGRDHP